VETINSPAQGGKPENCHASKKSLLCKLMKKRCISPEIYRLSFSWRGPAPKAGQFFMLKPERTRVFLGRPISVASWNPSGKIIDFLFAVRGAGTVDLANMHQGEYAELTGPLGNSWGKYLPVVNGNENSIALISGGMGVAPLEALAAELPEYGYDFYAGFKTGFKDDTERAAMLSISAKTGKGNNSGLIIATEDGSEGRTGLITDFLEPKKYTAVCACGPELMLKAVAGKCRAAGVPCLVSMEQYMACGVGACLGCTIITILGNKRCCADGPIFPAEELYFDE